MKLSCWFDASFQRIGLYKSLEWKEIAHVDIDLGTYGGEKGKTRRTVCMIRRPQPFEKVVDEDANTDAAIKAGIV